MKKAAAITLGILLIYALLALQSLTGIAIVLSAGAVGIIAGAGVFFLASRRGRPHWFLRVLTAVASGVLAWVLVYSPAWICPERIGPYLGFLGAYVLMFFCMVAGFVGIVFGAGVGQGS